VTVVRIRKRVDALGEAIRWDGSDATVAEIVEWSNGHAYRSEDGTLYIETRRRGDQPADIGDYIVLGPVPEDYYPCDEAAYHAGWEELGEWSQ
jgi:hypothetical protein